VELENHCRFNLGYLGSDHGLPEQGAGNDALALRYDRHATRSSAFHHSRRRVCPWSSSHMVTKHKSQANPLIVGKHRIAL
jgi:hypothetical protein